MFPAWYHPLSYLLLLAMAWTAVWCCCAPPRRAIAERSCCAVTKRTPVCPGQTPAGCPIDRVRQTSVAPVAPVLPDAQRIECPLPVDRLVLSLPISRSASATPAETADPPFEPPTLLALHTSLVC